MQPHEHIIVAYDRSTANDDDIKLVHKLQRVVGGIKIGLEAATAITPGNSIPVYFRLLPIILHLKLLLMADWKLKDIPNTVGRAVANIARLHNAWGITMHADADLNVIEAAVKNRELANIIGVTVLTSMSTERCEIVHGRDSKAQVEFLVRLLLEGGAQAVVCSPLEIEIVRKIAHKQLIVITPGIRSRSAPPDDQKRTMTAGDAIRAGADYLVIGRPIMEAADPIIASHAFAEEIATAKANRSMV